MKIEIIRFSPGWWLWLPGLSKQLDLRASDERPSKEEFKAQVQLHGPRLNVARLAAGSIHHRAPEWVSRVRRAAREDTSVSGCICSWSPWRRPKPQNWSKAAGKSFLVWFSWQRSHSSWHDPFMSKIKAPFAQASWSRDNLFHYLKKTITQYIFCNSVNDWYHTRSFFLLSGRSS